MQPILHAQAFWTTGPLAGELREEIVPEPGPREVLVRTLYSGISRGTEALVFRNEVPPDEYQRMRAPFQAGQFPAPVKYGYISVGQVEAGPATLIGQTVFCLHPHQSRYVVPADAVLPLPPGVPPERAILAANMETAINGLWDARPALGDRIAVIGAGAVGCLLAWLAGRLPGCEVELIDVNPQRSTVARTLSVNFSSPEQAAKQADLVFHASGNPAGLDLALSLAAFEATILEMSWFGKSEVTLPLGGAFHSQRLSIRASQVGTIPAVQQARWSHRRRLGLALRLLTEPALDCLITGESRFTELPAVLANLTSTPANSICHRISYL